MVCQPFGCLPRPEDPLTRGRTWLSAMSMVQLSLRRHVIMNLLSGGSLSAGLHSKPSFRSGPCSSGIAPGSDIHIRSHRDRKEGDERDSRDPGSMNPSISVMVEAIELASITTKSGVEGGKKNDSPWIAFSCLARLKGMSPTVACGRICSNIPESVPFETTGVAVWSKQPSERGVKHTDGCSRAIHSLPERHRSRQPTSERSARSIIARLSVV